MRTSYRAAGQLAGDHPQLYSGPKHDPHATAWVVLTFAFAIFWGLVIGAVIGGKNYYETAFESKNATLSLEAGIVLYRDAVTSTLINASDKMDLREGDEVLVGQGARASVSLFDGTTIALYSGSELSLQELRQSKFHDGFSHETVALNKGTARLQVSSPSTRTSRFVAATPFGSALLNPGNYGLEVSDDQTRFSARAGSALVWSKNGSAGMTSGEKAVVTADSVTGPLPEGDALVKNGSFAQGFSQWTPLDINETGRPEEPGQRTLVPERLGGRDTVALRVQRLSPQGTHNETGLTQLVNKDVSDYQSLRLRANVKVTGQSLSGGGYMGYEYPIMIRVRYRDATGGQIDWTHGFFATNPEGRPTPNGEDVPRGEWVAYDGELTQVNPRPVYIIAVEVLGAGHTFDGSITNVELVAK
jgi:hypothetical protein